MFRGLHPCTTSHQAIGLTESPDFIWYGICIKSNCNKANDLIPKPKTVDTVPVEHLCMPCIDAPVAPFHPPVLKEICILFLCQQETVSLALLKTDTHYTHP